jgi:hypothetical protein
MQRCDTVADADIFVAHVPSECAPLPAHQRNGAFIAQGGIGIGERGAGAGAGIVEAGLERLVLGIDYRGGGCEAEDEQPEFGGKSGDTMDDHFGRGLSGGHRH